MQIYPQNALDQLQFHRLLDEMSDYAAGSKAQSTLRELLPGSELHVIVKRLNRVDFFMKQVLDDRHLHLEAYGTPRDLNRVIEIEGFVLPKIAFHHVLQILNNAQRIEEFILKARKENSEVEIPFSAFPDTSVFFEELKRVMDDEGEIKPTASDALLSINKKIQRKQSEISSVFEKFAKQYRSQGLLSEIGESYRNGRRVLALPAENKRKISGIIHGESESRKTVFIEPQGVTEVNNALFQLELDKQKEEYKILQKLSESLSVIGYDVIETIDLVEQFDLHHAIAIYSVKRKFVIPVVDQEAHIHLKQAFHPNLEKHLAEEDKKVVKNNIVLHGKNKVLLLSGPNAGGKSVLLKTVAFNQIMFQCGLPVAADGNSRFRVFNKLALDMGDNQSIEDDLSTYSSHLLHMRQMLEWADDSTMLLIDEFGTGTDPRVGGALAESILHQYIRRSVTAVITTHYSNLKSYAHKMRGIVNGSMSFDMEQLSPTYKVQIGKPGSSFAFEIAKRMGLPDKIIDAARKKAGSQVYEMEKLLSQLTHEKEVLATKREEMERQERELKVLTKTYSDLKAKLDVQRKKYKAERKEELAKLKVDNIKKLESKLNEFKKLAKTEQKIAAQLEAEKAEQIKHIEQAKTLNTEAHKLSGEWVKKEDLNVGDFVRIRASDSVGKILSLEKKAARVAVGALSVDVPYRNLIKASDPIRVKTQRSIQYVKPQTSIPSRLDIRGMTFKEANEVLVQYFDDALIRHMSQVEILHGRGNGVLKKLVRQIARDYKDIQEVSHPEEEAGGEAMSIVRF